MKLPQFIRRSVRLVPLLALLLLLTGSAPALADAPAAIEPVESWRSGFNLARPVRYAATIGRALSPVGQAASATSTGDSYFAFPARGYAKTVQSAQVHLLSRSGSAPEMVSLSLEVLAMDGTPLRTLTSQPLDLQTAPTGQWIALELQASHWPRSLEPGEFLAFHIHTAGGPAGDLETPLLFECIVGPQGPELLFFPVIAR